MELTIYDYKLKFRILADKVSLSVSHTNGQEIDILLNHDQLTDKKDILLCNNSSDTQVPVNFSEKITIENYTFVISVDTSYNLCIGMDFSNAPAKSVFVGTKNINGPAFTFAYFKEP